MITIDPPRTSPGFALSRAGLSSFLKRVRTAVGIDGEIEVLLADDTTLRRLNRIWRGKNKATDVLSFPAEQAGHTAGEALAGDLAISLDMAGRQAAEHGLSLRDEVRILLLHGALHLAGYDHETDSGEMAAREADLRGALRLPTGLIARSETEAPGRHRSPAPRRTSARRGTSASKRDAR